MELNNLTNTPGARKSSKRVGRGCGSGLGKTSGKGQKGQQSRKGHKHKLQFEGGQMPLVRRLPKRGFTNKWATEYVAINVSTLNIFEDGDVVGPVELIQAGIIKKIEDGVKIMGNGELTKKLTVQAMKFTASAKEKIEAAGGKVEVI